MLNYFTYDKKENSNVLVSMLHSLGVKHTTLAVQIYAFNLELLEVQGQRRASDKVLILKELGLLIFVAVFKIN